MNQVKKPYFKLSDYILMSMIASMGIAVKVIIVPLAHILTGPLFIPGGVVAGGFYMAFLVLGEAITRKHGTATIIALIQAVVVLITGTLGSHGAASLFTYTLPGIAVDMVFLILRCNQWCMLSCFIGGVAANVTGSFAVNLTIFNLSFVPLMLSLLTAALTGGLGGLISYSIASNLRKFGVLGKGAEASSSVPLPSKEMIDKTIGAENEK
ncbi:MAG: ECF transporter S component [Eubacteriales bacterium]